MMKLFRGGDKGVKHRVAGVWTALKLWVELAGDKKRMIF